MKSKVDVSPFSELRQPDKAGQIDARVAQEIIDTLPAFMHWFRSEMRKLARPALTIAQLRILTKLYQSPKTMTELIEIQGVSAPAISKMITTLEKRDLVERVQINKDRRLVGIQLTQKGRNIYLSIQSQVQKIIEMKVSELRPSRKMKVFSVLQYLKDFYI
jgi:DNA-binding MarR family transcriptional regulator